MRDEGLADRFLTTRAGCLTLSPERDPTTRKTTTLKQDYYKAT